MGCVQETRNIGGKTFKVSQLPARRALEMFSRLGRALGPAAFEAIAKGGAVLTSKGEDDEVSPEEMLPALAPALASLFDRLPEGELSAIADTLLEPATCDGQLIKSQFDDLFQGHILLLLQVLAFAIEVNYRDFFDAGRGLFARPKKGAEASKDSSQT